MKVYVLTRTNFMYEEWDVIDVYAYKKDADGDRDKLASDTKWPTEYEVTEWDVLRAHEGESK